MPECPECGSPPAPGQRTCHECGVSLPGWELAASAYATTLQPDYDADWADTAVTAAVRAPARSFGATMETPVRTPVAVPGEETPRSAPQDYASPSYAARHATFAEQEDTWKQRTPSGERAPLWTPADAAPLMPQGVDAQMPWRTLITLVVLAVVAGAAYFAYPRAQDWWAGRSAPAELRGYVAGNGVSHAPAGEGYSVRLPKTPVHNDTPRSALSAPWVAIHRSVVSGDDYRIVVRVADLSRAGAVPFGGAAALGDPRIAGRVTAANVRTVTFAGQPAFDFDGAGRRPVRGRLFLRDARLYVVTVEAEGADAVFDELMRSFTLVA
jgi:hypothetical protein